LIERGNRVTLLISTKQVDSRLVLAYGHLDFERLPGAAFGKHPMQLVRFLKGLFGGLFAGVRLLRKADPDLVLAFGGFLSLGVVLPAVVRGIPVALHEANRRPGRSIRTLRRFARRLYLPEGIGLPGVREEKIRHFGYPVRREFQRMSKDVARGKLGLPARGFLLVVIGGSQGAAALNEWAEHHGDALMNRGISVYCVRGLGDAGDSVRQGKDEQGLEQRMTAVGFCDRMHWVFSAADLAVSRAGAGSIAELKRALVPSILVPYPHAADDHQLANARFLEADGGCLVVQQGEIETLFDRVLFLYESDARLAEMRDRLLHASDPDRKSDFASDLERLA